jgi:hypothetical protein
MIQSLFLSLPRAFAPLRENLFLYVILLFIFS